MFVCFSLYTKSQKGHILAWITNQKYEGLKSSQNKVEVVGALPESGMYTNVSLGLRSRKACSRSKLL